MSKVRKDNDGLFVKTGGYVFRPKPVLGYDHAYDMSDGNLKPGMDVKARHMGGSPLAKLTLLDGSNRYWYAD